MRKNNSINKNMKKNYKKGFTLIELLVVVAIIGILAAIVLASLSSARNKGKDAAIESQLASMRDQAELYYLSQTSPTYLYVCSNGPSVTDKNGLQGLILATQKAGNIISNTTSHPTLFPPGIAGSFQSVSCADSPSAWAVDAPLSDGVSMWCVDSTGASKKENTFLPAGATACAQ